MKTLMNPTYIPKAQLSETSKSITIPKVARRIISTDA